MTLPTDPVFLTTASLAIILVGLGKGGFSGLGAASMPLLALVMDPVKAAAMLLPILLLQDVVGVWAFRKSFDLETLKLMVPGAVVGIFLGWLLATLVPSDMVRGAVGVIAVAFGGYRLLGLKVGLARPLPRWLGGFLGVLSGFTGQVALSGGPPFQIWALTRKLPHTVFIGTSSIFFAITNWIKVPAYIALGQFTADNFTLTAVFLPIAVISTFAGVWLVKRVDAERFYTLINLLMIAVGMTLLWDTLR